MTNDRLPVTELDHFDQLRMAAVIRDSLFVLESLYHLQGNKAVLPYIQQIQALTTSYPWIDQARVILIQEKR